MNIYLDESYNLEKRKGTLFISINGFSIINDQALRKRWRIIRKPYIKSKQRIHATDSNFEELRNKSIALLSKQNATILSVFQVTTELPFNYFNGGGLNVEFIYTNLLKKLFVKLHFSEHKKIDIIIDARKHTGGQLGAKVFQNTMNHFLKSTFPTTNCIFKITPSYVNILVELADFVSNTFYKEYQNNLDHVFQRFHCRVIQIKNPL